MVRYSVLMVLLLIGAIPLFACNQCGCSTSNSALGLLPISTRNYAGTMLLYSHQSLYDDQQLLSNSFSIQKNAFGAYTFNEKWSVQAMMPVSYNVVQTISAESNSTVSELFPGDLQLLGRYVMKLGINESKEAVSLLSVSAGLELPTGTFNPDYKQEGLPASFYPGSKSFDPIAGLHYQFNKGNYTLSVNAQFRYSTYNKDHFKAGTQVSSAALASRKFGSWAPFCGLGFDLKGSDLKYTFEQAGSDYELAYAMAGLEWAGKNVLFGTRNHFNVYNQFGDTDAKSPGMLSVYFSYFF
jgi:hypothetical protein